MRIERSKHTRELDGEGMQSKMFLLLGFQKQRANYETSMHN